MKSIPHAPGYYLDGDTVISTRRTNGATDGEPHELSQEYGPWGTYPKVKLRIGGRVISAYVHVLRQMVDGKRKAPRSWRDAINNHRAAMDAAEQDRLARDRMQHALRRELAASVERARRIREALRAA